MRLIDLLRLPASGFPPEAATGDPTLDAFLRDIDRRLVGSRSVRRPHLLELADHLVEARDRAIETGRSPDGASRSSVEAFGNPESMAAAQRRARARIFRVTALASWPCNGILLVLLLILIDFPDWTLFWMLTVLPLGLFMGYGFAYSLGTPSTPGLIPPESEPEGTFTVSLTGGERLAGVVLLLGTASAAGLMLAGLMGWGLFAEAPWEASLFVLIMAGLLLTVTGPILVHIEVDPEGLGYRSAFRDVRVRWDHLVGMDKELAQAATLRPPIGPKVRLRWRAEPDGPVSEIQMHLDGSMTNFDRLLAALDHHAPAGASKSA